ncbi:MAG TPA: NAD-dependent epimerase/dehydratase family protein [Candidatus Wujingus californicus]|uniref:NAD-dependent epimerase/dehydratase family protein n=1 Tax=Candidatus Wujingus californicus TaxID=3367618 RepID=UPI001E12CFC6|nr:NAD-dependent epimerase/dehydratase family protein [Planctomycetota bacterium]MDO8131039.1 NAD-dependent epimerase/dehydratase family protein [Candidatus Brocadiales bacterium]
MCKVLITGGAGFIGYHLAKFLSDKRIYEIHIVDSLSRGEIDSDFKKLINNNNIKFKKADLTNSKSYKLLSDDYDYIYHLSAIVGVKNTIENPDRVLYVNIVSTLNLINWINGTQANLKKFLFASTSEIYAGTMKHYGIPVPTDEKVVLCLEDISSPRTTYSLSKIVGESACLNYFKKYRVPVTIVRYHNIYGPRMGYDHVIPELMLKAKNSKDYLEVYSGSHTRAFCYIIDSIEATVNLAESEDSLGQIFNVGNSDEEITITELAGKIIKVVNPSLKVKPLSDQVGSPLRRCPNIDKLRNTIRFYPKVFLDEGIRLTWEWYKRH